MIGFGKLFGLQDIYEGDEELVRGGPERDESGGSTHEMERKWRDKVDGLSGKLKKVAKNAVHFVWASRISEECDEAEEA